MISNPATFFTSGNDQISFEYEGGSKLYHFCPKDSGLSKFYDSNVVLFADNEEHAKEVLIRMFTFKIGCMTIYTESVADGNVHNAKSKERIKHYLEHTDDWVITEAPMNQLYLVPWASNECI